jgi:enoyl-[acyl-carrier protein] reductase I
MPGLMQGKRGLVMGVANDHSIAWGIAKTLAAHGATLAFTYQGEALGRRVKPAGAIRQWPTCCCRVTSRDTASVDATFATIAEKWGSLDFLVHAIAFSDKNELKAATPTPRARTSAHHADLLLLVHPRWRSAPRC